MYILLRNHNIFTSIYQRVFQFFLIQRQLTRKCMSQDCNIFSRKIRINHPLKRGFNLGDNLTIVIKSKPISKPRFTDCESNCKHHHFYLKKISEKEEKLSWLEYGEEIKYQFCPQIHELMQKQIGGMPSVSKNRNSYIPVFQAKFEPFNENQLMLFQQRHERALQKARMIDQNAQLEEKIQENCVTKSQQFDISPPLALSRIEQLLPLTILQ